MSDSFPADWLALRAPFDQAARGTSGPRGLVRRFAAAAAAVDRPLRLLDLGGGTGANVRTLAPRLAGDQTWTLLDDDADLLARVEAECMTWAARIGWSAHRDPERLLLLGPDRRVEVRGRLCNLAEDFDDVDLADFDGLTAAALLDLVSAAWLQALVDRWSVTHRPLLFALTVDGRISWSPPRPEDPAVIAAFRRDLQRDKGFGRALGIAAHSHATTALEGPGYSVETATSDWLVDPHERAMHLAMIDFVAAAARRATPLGSGDIEAWDRARRAQAAAGMLRLHVGHVDLLGSWPDRSPSC